MHPSFPGLAGRCTFGVHNNSGINGIRALAERVFFSPDESGQLVPPPRCTADVNTTLSGFKAQLLKAVGGARPLSREQFVSFYTGRRRLVYERAAESLAARPLTKGEFGVRNAFVKAEKINFTAKPDPAPRVIQPRDPRYNVEVGVYLKHIEHKIYHGIAEMFGGPTVMKGYNAQEVAAHMHDMWNEFNDPVAVGLDASRFDQHVRPEMLAWEHSVYAGLYHGADRERLQWLLSGQIKNKCTMRTPDCQIKYLVDGSRMSGDMNTALGNCLIMCALIHRLAQERKVRVRLANNGDDCVVFCERRSLTRLIEGLGEWFRTYGFNMKQESPVSCFEEVEFCQAHPVCSSTGWIMVRDPRVSISKDAICTVRDYGHGAAARKWLQAVGECGTNMAGGLPMLDAYYSAYLRHGTGKHLPTVVAESGMYMLSKGLHRAGVEISDGCRVSFFKAFDVSPSWQRDFEEHMAGVTFSIPASPCIRPTNAPGFLPF
ncbi:hypothetical protein 2 [Changjiang tombus-like virus 7]|uniref:hypothetical protein 2 n=1 Tax=Changjiang tombus-like virus 7 TaxID=1922821 RepID=UPI00090C64C4|nr:hypothetical protein 2 [Changjiang tombus-like virus 7]APG76272.1 hypothetical protein 2 [Changjiang tombus-like virus 7]